MSRGDFSGAAIDGFSAIPGFGAFVRGADLASSGTKAVKIASTASQGVPSRLARVVDADIEKINRLGPVGAKDVFVTSADDIAGITNATDLAKRLTLKNEFGHFRQGPFKILEFDNPVEGLASPVFRNNSGFLQGGFTQGGASEFVLPNLTVDQLKNVTVRTIK